MADYPTLDKASLAAFSGRPAESYGPYAEQALKEAKLFFKRNTCLSALPEDEDSIEMATYAILSLADQLVLLQPHQETMASPLASEVIGSYSYSLKQNLQTRQSTGIMWFDFAISEMGVCEYTEDVQLGGGLEVFEYDLPRVPGRAEGQEQIVGRGDASKSAAVFHDPSRSSGAQEPALYETEHDGIYVPSDSFAQELIEDPPGSGVFVPKENV